MRYFCALTACLLFPAFAHAEPATLEDAVPDTVLERKERILTFEHENDMFAGSDDGHFTSGSRMSYMDRNLGTPDFVHVLDRLIPTFEVNETTTVIYSLGQNIFTPEDKTIAAPQPNDRPWAGFLYGSVGVATLTDNHVDEIEATLGVVGTWALAEPTQKFIHKIVNSPQPKGWDNQLENEPGLMISAQRKWPEAFVSNIGSYRFSAAPYGGATLGNVYTYANTGVSFRFGDGSERWDDTPLRVRPAMPGTGYFDAAQGGPDWFIFGGIEGRAVARNIFLDGNTFRDSASVDKLPFVLDANLGLATTIGPTRVSYTVVWRSKEFHKQNDPDLFGAVSVGYRF